MVWEAPQATRESSPAHTSAVWSRPIQRSPHHHPTHASRWLVGHSEAAGGNSTPRECGVPTSCRGWLPCSRYWTPPAPVTHGDTGAATHRVNASMQGETTHSTRRVPLHWRRHLELSTVVAPEAPPLCTGTHPRAQSISHGQRNNTCALHSYILSRLDELGSWWRNHHICHHLGSGGHVLLCLR